MKNIYGLPEDELEKIKARDILCVYCHKEMKRPVLGEDRKDWATIEHLNHLPPWDNVETVAFCCMSCNASRRDKTIPDWFESYYCKERNINIQTVSQPVKDYLKNS